MSVGERADFSYIRYSNCWEDARVLTAGIGLPRNATCLSITSAGDNTFALLTGDPGRVISVDLNPAQTALAVLKARAFVRLSHEEMLRFLGFRSEDAGRRTEMYGYLAESLPLDTRRFWDAHPDAVAGGVIHGGKFERYFRIFRSLVLPLIHSRRTIDGLLQPRDRSGREAFYEEEWNTARWRGTFALFFSRFVMGRLGRDPEFFRQVSGSVSRRILERTRYALTVLPVADNPWVRYIMTGSFGEALPEYARVENFEAIARNIDALEFRTGDLLGCLDSGEAFDGMNLSDIFEYLSPEETSELGTALSRRLRPAGRMVYWEMLADRNLAEHLPERFVRIDEPADRLHREDRAFFYKRLHIMEKVG